MAIWNEKYECMSREEMKNLQSERLVKLVARVYKNVEAYRNKMDKIGLKPEDIKSIDDLTKLPFTVKQDLRDNYPFGLFAVPKDDICRVHASSGTTGKLTVVGYTKNDLEMWSEVMARSMTMAGASKSSTIHIAYGYGLFTGGLGMHYGAEKIGAITVPVSSGNTKRQLMLMKDFQTDVLCCTPSYAIYLADEMEKEGYKLSDFNLKYGIFGAEPWSNEMREEIERRLKIIAHDIYGLSEIVGPGVAMECDEKCGSHIEEDNFLPEIINPETLEPVGEGEEGELVFTTLTKEGMPLIRYRTRDITSLNYEKCKCGRTTVRMNKVKGRSDDMLIIRGVNVFPSQIETVLMSIGDGIAPFYMIIVNRVGMLDTLEVQVELTEKFYSDEVKKLEELKTKIENNLHFMLGISARVKLVEPNSLPRSEGKAVRIIDNRKI